MAPRKQHPRESTGDAHRNSSFPFLGLPQEIRNRIYRLLLANPSVYENASGDVVNTYLKLYPAVLLTNKKINKEAESILKFFRQNELVVLKIGTHTLINGSTYKIGWGGIPAFRTLSGDDITDPVLSVTIKPLEETQTGPERFKSLVTTTKDIRNIINAIWQAAKACNFYRTSSLTLRFHNQVSHRRVVLSNNILKPFGDIQGFKDVILVGNIDGNIIEYLNDRMNVGFRLRNVIVTLESFSSKADSYFERKQYELALLEWHHMQTYWDYHFDLLKEPNARPIRSDGTISEALECTLPLLVRKVWGSLKAYLHLPHVKEWYPRYGLADSELAKLDELKEIVGLSLKAVNFVKDLVDEHQLKYCMAPDLEAKFYICGAIASRLCNDDRDAARSYLYISIPNILARNNLFEDKSMKLYNGLEIGIERYFIRDRMLFYNGQDMLRADDIDGFLRPICGLFWEWLGLPDGPGWPIVDLKTMMQETWDRLKEEIRIQITGTGRGDYSDAIGISAKGARLSRMLAKTDQLKCHLDPVLEAKFLICNAMANWACEHHDDSRKVLHTMLPTLLARNKLFVKEGTELYHELENGISKFLKTPKDQSKYVCKDNEVLKRLNVDKTLRLLCRPFWEWLGLPNGPGWPING